MTFCFFHIDLKLFPFYRSFTTFMAHELLFSKLFVLFKKSHTNIDAHQPLMSKRHHSETTTQFNQNIKCTHSNQLIVQSYFQQLNISIPDLKHRLILFCLFNFIQFFKGVLAFSNRIR